MGYIHQLVIRPGKIAIATPEPETENIAHAPEHRFLTLNVQYGLPAPGQLGKLRTKSKRIAEAMGLRVVPDEVPLLANLAQSAKKTSSKINKSLSITSQDMGLTEKVARGLQEIVTEARHG